MSSTFPAITPRETVFTPARPITTNSAYGLYHSHGGYGIYPPFVKTSIQIPRRVNPLIPPPPAKKMNHMFETVDPHYINEKRKLLMQQREHYRYHNTWSKAYYGSPAEKEAYRKETRSVLKQQMFDKGSNSKDNLKFKARESETSISHDRQCMQDDADDYLKKFNYLKQYRDDNKRLMESAWSDRRQRRQVENRYDLEQMRYNPINWSCTLT